MITLVEAVNFRCLRNVRQPLDRFHVLVGPNASGKTTFLDVVAFLGKLVSDGVESAVRERASNPSDLVWRRKGDRFELAIEARIPEKIRHQLANDKHDTIRYEVAIRTEPELAIAAETVLLKASVAEPLRQIELFPSEPVSRSSLLSPRGQRGVRTIINKVDGGNDNFYSETYRDAGKGWAISIKLGVAKSAFGNLPADESNFPAATWLRELLTNGVQQFVLNSLAIRRASPPGQRRGFKTDGSNLPWVIHELEQSEDGRERLSEWVNHLATALPDLEGIRTIERPDDKHRYLMLRYRNGVEIPSWLASDGTLRMLALTLPAYLPNFDGVYLIEEPENGIHPRAVEAVFQSLSSVYDAQILVASHSPVVLSLVERDDVLCFAKTDEGATCIVRGSEHPALRNWQGETNLGMLFAAGVLS